MSKNFILISFFKKFEFPLREAGRKQIFWRAERLAERHSVEIWCIGDGQCFSQSGILIKEMSILKMLIRLICSSREERYELHSAIFQFVCFLFCITGKVQKLFLYDGEPVPERRGKVWSALMRRLLMRICILRSTFTIAVFSDYQKLNIGNIPMQKVKPILPDVPKISSDSRKTKYPSVLFMGHISEEKGILTILKAMEILAKKKSNIILKIANNSISTDRKCLDLTRSHIQKWENIRLLGVVDPFRELSKSWAYLYPFNVAHGTMAFSMSIYEAVAIGKPVIACDVGANREFFPDVNLIPTEKIFSESYLSNLIEEVILRNEY